MYMKFKEGINVFLCCHYENLEERVSISLVWHKAKVLFGLGFFLFNGISTFVIYLMPKPFS